MSTADSTTRPTAAEVTAFRERMGVTKADAARAARTTWRAYQQWETGDRPMSQATWALMRATLLAATGHHTEALAVLMEPAQDMAKAARTKAAHQPAPAAH